MTTRLCVVLGISVLVILMVLLGALKFEGVLEPSQQHGSSELVSPTTSDYKSPTDAFNHGAFTVVVDKLDSEIAKNPRDISALLAKASTLAQQGSLQFKENEYGIKAIAVAQQALALDPKNSEAWRIIGYAHEIMQEYTEAHAAYAQSLLLNASNALTISQDAHAWDLQGRLDKAQAGYKKALSIDSKLEHASMGMARLLMRNGNDDGALPFFLKTASSSQNDRIKAEAFYSAGVVYSGRNERNEPPRVCRRLQLLREWSHDQRIKNPEVLCRGA